MADATRVRRRPRLAVGIGALVVIALVTGVAVWATEASGSTGYRTATVTNATVRQTLGVSGTVEPVHEAVAAFQVAGTVASVAVTVGQHVTAGQKLATLGATTLQQDVTLAASSLTAAQARLTEDESGEAATASTTADVAGATASPVIEDAFTVSVPLVGATKPSRGGTTGSGTTLQQAQQAVVSAQQTADADAQKASAALAQAQAVCATTTTPPPTSTTTTTLPPPSTTTTAPTTSTTLAPTTTTSPTSSPTPAAGAAPAATTPAATTPAATTPAVATPAAATPAAATTSTTLPHPGGSASCATALSHALAAQQQVATDQRAVSAAETALAQVLSTSSSTHTGSSATTGSGTGTGSTRSGGTGTGSTSSGGTSSGTSTTGTGAASNSAQQLASDQSTIDSDQSSLIEAQQSLADARLTSPIAGTVAAVAISRGQAVTAGSASSTITVINSGTFEATASLTSTQVATVKVGDGAIVTVDGVNGTISGTVSRVGPVDASGTSFTYPLVVALPAGSAGLSGGATAQLQVVLHEVAYALAVPTSAVHTTGADESYVLVLKSGRETRTKVSVGAVGGVYTQINSGVTKGTPVVLADLAEAIPASSSNATTGRFGGAGFGGSGGLTARRGGGA